MPFMVLKASFLSLDGVDRSANCSKIEVTAEVEEKDVTTFASAGWKEVLGGIASGSLAPTIKNDFAGIDAALWPKFGLLIPFEVRASNAVVSAANPKFTGSVLVKSLTPISGSPGDVNEASYTWPTSGPIVRAIA
ncbi:hypothetical protein [Micromonospora thermarum]|uniref:Phage tail protein n=1 Tax=Micromonospora thermarum TaxID=2720024 RepID=A0ABX0ZCH9_9ACTN|nr:hypothetical protein [Micromonospora thermarum]NJP33683.1 hypothetical protein [Micromonospora thermarum]